MPAEFHVGDIGTIFRATVQDQDGVAVDISAASPRQLIFRKPDGTVVMKTAVLTGSGTDGKMQYSTILGDLDQAGPWVAQGYVKIGTGEWHTDEYMFRVYPNLN